MSTSTESSFTSMQYVVRIVVTVTILFGLLLVIDPPFSTLGIVLSALVMLLLIVAVFLLRKVIRPDRSIIQNLFR
jgi:phosphate starvation-inducible membrane PsiE